MRASTVHSTYSEIYGTKQNREGKEICEKMRAGLDVKVYILICFRYTRSTVCYEAQFTHRIETINIRYDMIDLVDFYSY